MERWMESGKKIRKFANPATFPIAIKLTCDESQIPSTAKRPLRDLGVRMAPCQGATMARRYGWTLAFGKEDVGCAIAAQTYGWDRLTDAEGVIKFLKMMNYASDEEAARRIMESLRLLEIDGRNPENLFVIYSPLEWTKIEPDVVLIYVNPAQMMRLIHGVTHKSGKPIESSFSGRAASCTEGVICAYMDREPMVVVPGNGDRVWAGCQDHEMVMAIPAGRLPEMIEGLEKTHQLGIRYPIPTYMRYSPEVAFSLPLSDIFKPELLNKFK